MSWETALQNVVGDSSDGINEMQNLESELSTSGKDPCFQGFVYFGHGSVGSDNKMTGDMTWDNGGYFFKWFKSALNHDLRVCVMAMCGADAADWAGTVGGDGVYAGGEGKFYPSIEQNGLIERVERAAGRQ